MSGGTGKLIRTFAIAGEEVAILAHVPVGDVDGDKVPDFVFGLRASRLEPAGEGVTEPEEGWVTRLEVRSGASGAVLRETSELNGEWELGNGSIRAIVDPLPNAPRNGFYFARARPSDVDPEAWDVRVVSARSLHGVGTGAIDEAPSADAPLITSLVAREWMRAPFVDVGDLDGDEISETIDATTSAESREGCTVRILSGAGGEVLASQHYERIDPIRRAPLVIGDVNGDGAPDLLIPFPKSDVMAPIPHQADLPVCSGRDLSVLYLVKQKVSTGFQPNFGMTQCALGDVNGDGTPDFAIGAYDPWSNRSTGRVEIRSGRDGAHLRSVNRRTLLGG